MCLPTVLCDLVMDYIIPKYLYVLIRGYHYATGLTYSVYEFYSKKDNDLFYVRDSGSQTLSFESVLIEIGGFIHHPRCAIVFEKDILLVNGMRIFDFHPHRERAIWGIAKERFAYAWMDREKRIWEKKHGEWILNQERFPNLYYIQDCDVNWNIFQSMLSLPKKKRKRSDKYKV
jgi:hypothetical protein